MIILLIGVFMLISLDTLMAEEVENGFYRHTIETSPVSPILQMKNTGIWGVKYEYALTPKDELKIDISYYEHLLPRREYRLNKSIFI